MAESIAALATARGDWWLWISFVHESVRKENHGTQLFLTGTF